MEYPIHMPVFAPGHPLYLQLYQHLAREIQQGRPGPGKKLPSKRRLCAMLGVSMSTVEGAYSLLLAEGYVKSLPRSGYVAAQLHDVPVQSVPDLPAPPEPPSQWRYDCSTSAVDTSVFPFSSWARINKDSVYQNPGLLQPGHPQGDEPLRVALAGLLAQYRGVRCSPEQIVVGAGTDYLLSLLLQLFPQGSVVALEDPGYPTAWQAVERHGHRPISIPVDASGMCPRELEQSEAVLAYVTPSHQFPLGVTMPVERRSRLLRWAAQGEGRYVLEDDYDSEFRYASRPIPALQGLDAGGRVIYLGTFSRSIAPPSVLPTSSCPRSCWPDTAGCSPRAPAPSPGLSRRPCASSWSRGCTAAICADLATATAANAPSSPRPWPASPTCPCPVRGQGCTFSSPPPTSPRGRWFSGPPAAASESLPSAATATRSPRLPPPWWWAMRDSPWNSWRRAPTCWVRPWTRSPLFPRTHLQANDHHRAVVLLSFPLSALLKDTGGQLLR